MLHALWQPPGAKGAAAVLLQPHWRNCWRFGECGSDSVRWLFTVVQNHQSSSPVREAVPLSARAVWAELCLPLCFCSSFLGAGSGWGMLLHPLQFGKGSGLVRGVVGFFCFVFKSFLWNMEHLNLELQHKNRCLCYESVSYESWKRFHVNAPII